MKKNIFKYMKLLLWLIIYKISLDILYIFVISPRYGYYGLRLDFDVYKYLISWIIFIIYTILLSKFISKSLLPSKIILIVLFVVSFIPTNSFYGLSNEGYLFIVYYSIYWGLIILLANIILKYSVPKIHFIYAFKYIKIRDDILNILTIVFGIYVFYISYNYNGLYINLSIMNVYDLRLAAKNTYFGTFAGYFMTWSAVIFAFSAVQYYNKKKWILFILTCYLQLLLFSINGMKTTLFYIPTSIIASILLKKEKIYYIPFGLFILNVLSFLAKYTFNFILPAFLFQFRVLYLPSVLNKEYYEYFSKNPPDYLAQSIFRRIGIKSKYNLPIPNIIDSLTRDGSGYANNGMFGDAFSNFGIAGIVIYPFLLIGLLRILDFFAKDLNLEQYFVIIIIFTITLTNVSFFTGLLNNGILFSFLLLALVNHNKNKVLYYSK